MPSKKALVTSGMVDALDAAIANNQAAIQAGGLDVAALRSRLSTAKSGVVNTDAAKEDAYRIAEQATATADDAEQTGYDTASSVIDAVSGAVGKKSPLGQQILAIRADANKRRKGRAPLTNATPS